MPQPSYAPVESLPTRQLLDYLNLARKFGGWYSPVDSHSNIGYTFDELKAEAAKREHVPNKQEAKELRRQRAQSKGGTVPTGSRRGGGFQVCLHGVRETEECPDCGGFGWEPAP